MRKVGCYIFITINMFLHGQNLINNASFEEFENPAQDVFYAKDWNAPKISSIDFYSEACSKKPLYKNFSYPCYPVLDSSSDFSQPQDGKSYVGLIIIGWNSNIEHYTGKLIRPLIKDSIYDIEFYLKYYGDNCWIYSKKLEILFTKEELYINDGNYLFLYKNRTNLSADIEVDIQEVNKTRDWTKCHARYKAYGGEKYLTFGLFNQTDRKFTKQLIRFSKISSDYQKVTNFVDKKRSKTIYSNPKCDRNINNYNHFIYAYYFLDNVSLKPLTPNEWTF